MGWFWERGRPSAVFGERSWAWIPMFFVYPFYLLVLAVGGVLYFLAWVAFAPLRARQKRVDPEGYAASQRRT